MLAVVTENLKTQRDVIPAQAGIQCRVVVE
jgi:hypothetical protein